MKDDLTPMLGASPVPFPNPLRGRCGKGCLRAKVDEVREAQSATERELSAMMASVLDREMR